MFGKVDTLETYQLEPLPAREWGRGMCGANVSQGANIQDEKNRVRGNPRWRSPHVVKSESGRLLIFVGCMK